MVLLSTVVVPLWFYSVVVPLWFYSVVVPCGSTQYCSSTVWFYSVLWYSVWFYSVVVPVWFYSVLWYSVWFYSVVVPCGSTHCFCRRFCCCWRYDSMVCCGRNCMSSRDSLIFTRIS